MSTPVTLGSDQDPTEKTAPCSTPLEFTVIAVGGAIGACLRAGISFAFATMPLHAASAAFTANLLGSLLLGLLVGYLEVKNAPLLLRPFLAVGLLGSFTTFSALALDQRAIAAQSGEAVAAAMILGSIALGLAFFALGERIVTSAAANIATATKKPRAGRNR